MFELQRLKDKLLILNPDVGLLFLFGEVTYLKKKKKKKNLECVCVHMDEMQLCGLPKQLVHNNKLAEAVTFAQAPVLCVCWCVCVYMCVCCFPDGLIASQYHNRGFIALSQPLNTKNI